MHHDDFLPARGIHIARKAIALATGATLDEQLAKAQSRWGARSPVVALLKADSAGHEIGDADFQTSGTRELDAEFAEISDMGGLLQGLTSVPPNVPFVGAVTDPIAGWSGQSKAIPVSRAVLDRTTMQPMKITTMIVLTDELISSSDPRTEMLVLNMMARSSRKTADAAISDPSNTGDATMPASITSGATPISSTGDLADDAQALIDAYGGSLETAVFWMRPDLAAQAGLRAGAYGAGTGLGARGGVLAGIPVIVSDGIPADSSGSPLILVDRSSIAMVDQGFEIKRATQAMIEMSTAPTGATDSPTGAGTGTKLVSLFQESAVGLLLIRRVNWHLANPGAVVVVQDCDYTAAA